MTIISRGITLVVSSLLVLLGGIAAADPVTKVALRAPPETSGGFALADGNELVLSAAPREEESQAIAIYEPLAEYLSAVIGRKVVFRYAGNWGVYQGLMQKGAYDLAFDGPHFVSWRTENSRHNALLKIPGEHVFVVVVRKDNDKIREIRQLAGRAVCAHAPPNLGTLTMLNEFDNPARQPIIVNIDGWKNIYQGLIDGKCAAAALPLKQLEMFEKDGNRPTRSVFRGATLPDNSLTAGPRITPAEQDAIVRALLSPEGEQATARLRAKYARNKPFVAASNKEFAGLSTYLKNEWGF